MSRRLVSAITGSLLALLVLDPAAARSQPSPEQPEPNFSGVDTLGLPPSTSSQLKQALEQRHYIEAEKLLLPRVHQKDRSAQTAHLLSFLGGVYYLDQDYLHAAVAWKKSEAIAPLQPPVEFTLAMAYLKLGHPDWATQVLSTLAHGAPQEALYPYWLGRIQYDARAYAQAISYFREALAVDPRMARAWDNLGLCYYHQNQNALAVQSFRKAIDLDRSLRHPSAWPYLNLALTLQVLDRPAEAESNLREAIRLEPHFAQAHFELGNVLEGLGRNPEAITEFREAATADPSYPEPHFALARLYRKLGQESQAQSEVRAYLSLRAQGRPSPSSAPQALR